MSDKTQSRVLGAALLLCVLFALPPDAAAEKWWQVTMDIFFAAVALVLLIGSFGKTTP